MEVKLSQQELKEIAAEVAKLLQAGGSGAVTTSGSAGAAAGAKRGPKPGSARRGRPPKNAAPADSSAAAAPSQGRGKTYNIAEAAEVAGQHPNTIRRHIQSGRLPSEVVKGAYTITRSDLQAYARSLKKNK